MRRRTDVLARATLFIVGLQGCAVAHAATLVRNGEPAGVIVTAQDPTPAARLAALELQHHIEQITGRRTAAEEPW